MNKITRNITFFAIAAVSVASMGGCKAATATTAPAALAPGYLNAFDQTTGESLSSAHAFAASASSNAATLSASQKAALNVFINALDAAQIVYAAYHGGTATQAQVADALASVSTAQASFSTTVTGAK
jgi:hypothetical protein